MVGCEWGTYAHVCGKQFKGIDPLWVTFFHGSCTIKRELVLYVLDTACVKQALDHGDAPLLGECYPQNDHTTYTESVYLCVRDESFFIQEQLGLDRGDPFARVVSNPGKPLLCLKELFWFLSVHTHTHCAPPHLFHTRGSNLVDPASSICLS